MSVAAYSADEKTVEIAGIVTDGSQTVAGATVRLKATSIAATSDEHGRFTLGVPDKAWPVRVTACKEGYYIRGADAQRGAKDVKIVIEPYPATDAEGFQWTGFLPNPEVKDSCGNCHSNMVEPWLKAGHANSHRNPVFKSFYLGTAAQGKPGVGQGYRLDFPNTVGACAACHVPAAALDAPWATDPSKVKDTDTVGVHCHFCHLVEDVDLKDLGRRPGVLAMKFRRPPPPKRLFLGPFDDMDRGAGGYVPLYTQSAYCAPCHEAEYWGTRVRSTFSEWQASPHMQDGIECQTCHMPRDRGMTSMVAPGVQHAVVRHPSMLAEHLTRENEERLLREAVTLQVTPTVADGKLTVRVDVTNTGAGHDVPTGNARRNVVLFVNAVDDRGYELSQLAGEKIPAWGGVGLVDKGNYAGQPGKIFAKILEDEFERFPAPSWRRTIIQSDNRISAGATDTSAYTFEWPKDARQVTVEAKLLYRRFFKPDLDEKGWEIPDKVMASKKVVAGH